MRQCEPAWPFSLRTRSDIWTKILLYQHTISLPSSHTHSVATYTSSTWHYGTRVAKPGRFHRQTWRDAVGVKPWLRWEDHTFLKGLPHQILSILCRPKPPPALLVHLGPGSNTIHSQEEHLLRLNDAEQGLEERGTHKVDPCSSRSLNNDSICHLKNLGGSLILD